MSKQLELKVKILKYIEMSYKQDRRLTTKIISGGKNFKLSVDNNGKIQLSGQVGVLKFDGLKKIESMGIQLKTVSVTFKTTDDGALSYSGNVSFYGAVTFGVTGEVNLIELIKQCEWGLCKYRFDPEKIDKALMESGAY
ncbi:hypothetical protein [Photobacterium lutimaris]|uniref:Uncharacterized protein n=1 Tax=Photobacterium lutimaris TaxID=388278 RepID=A0A2T3J0F7_9GAMM|nr:hypothetical protein [Photobacterium lutimaris]PSU34572.1 hypothetical protein C9I99_05535 [Photobacterium lutimaris]TDR69154.1 hypothetical protein DFP78_1452 [Photobacterium lutimaris]